METRSYSQSLVASLTCLTILPGVRVGREGNRRGSFCPLASILTLVPPASITRIWEVFAFGDFFISNPLNGCGRRKWPSTSRGRSGREVLISQSSAIQIVLGVKGYRDQSGGSAEHPAVLRAKMRGMANDLL